MMHLLVVASFLLVSVCNAGDPCPPKYQLGPCTCTEIPVYMPPPQHGHVRSTTEVSSTSTTTISSSSRRRSLSEHHELHISRNDTFYTIVDCKRPKSIQDLDGVVSSALNRMLVDKLIVDSVPPVKEHALARLPSKWLSKVRVRSFQVLNSVLYGDFIWNKGRPFEGQENSLIWFAANNCSLTGFLTYNHWGTVHTQGLNFIPTIQGLNFSNNLLTEVTHMAFRYPPANLSTVILSHNCIQSVHGGAFLYTPLLRYLDLSHNILESIARNIFAAQVNNLEYINLSWNSLTTLPADFFNNMPSLKVVEISHNFLFTLAEKPWAAVWENLTYVDVAENFIGCKCELMWLVNILSPPEVNGTTAAPRSSSGQTILGTCSKIVQRGELTSRYELATLTRVHLDC